MSYFGHFLRKLHKNIGASFCQCFCCHLFWSPYSCHRSLMTPPPVAQQFSEQRDAKTNWKEKRKKENKCDISSSFLHKKQAVEYIKLPWPPGKKTLRTYTDQSVTFSSALDKLWCEVQKDEPWLEQRKKKTSCTWIISARMTPSHFCFCFQHSYLLTTKGTGLLRASAMRIIARNKNFFTRSGFVFLNYWGIKNCRKLWKLSTLFTTVAGKQVVLKFFGVFFETHDVSLQKLLQSFF